MARKKEPTKPLLAVKHDFVASLDNVIQHSINLISACEFVLRVADLPKEVKAELEQQVKEFRAAIFSEG